MRIFSGTRYISPKMCSIRSADDTRRAAELPALDNLLRRRGKVPDLARQRLFHNVSVERDRQPMGVAGRKVERARVLLAQIELHIPRRRVGDQVVARGVIHAPLAVVVDGEHPPVGHKIALVALHVKVVEREHHARKDLIGRHRAVAGLVSKLQTVQPSLCASKIAP